MIVHQAITNNGNGTLFGLLFDQLEQEDVVSVIAKYIISVSATVVDMVILVREKRYISSGHSASHIIPVRGPFYMGLFHRFGFNRLTVLPTGQVRRTL